jgi:hypothetical protein
MSNSMFVPLLRMPADISEVSFHINAAFLDFNLASPRVWFDNIGSSSALLTDGFIMIEGNKDGDQCWVSISRCAAELTGDDECTILADVKTRGSWAFAGVVAYALCKMAGRTIFNDAGELDGQETYSAESLKKVIGELIPHT